MVHQVPGSTQNRNALDRRRAARCAVIEQAQDVGVAALQQAVDQPAGRAGGPDHDNVWRQSSCRAPAPDKGPPEDVQSQDRKGPKQSPELKRPGDGFTAAA
jgi:hypothetical protein